MYALTISTYATTTPLTDNEHAICKKGLKIRIDR